MPLLDERSRKQLEHLRKALESRENMRLLVFLCGAALAVLAVHRPIRAQIDEAEERLELVRERADLVTATDGFRSQVRHVQRRLHSTENSDEWVQYILTGTRQSGVKFRKYEPGSPRRMGPYEVLELTFEVEGSYQSTIRFLQWIERNERLLRIESFRMEQLPGGVKLRIGILGFGTRDATLLPDRSGD